MNREIKFRAWFPKSKLMVTDLDEEGIELYTHSGDGSLSITGHFADEETKGEVAKKWHDDGVLLQFSGLLDKNGKEIYEGDLLLCPVYDEKPLVVIYQHGAFVAQSIEDYKKQTGSYFIGYSDDEFYGTEVIGNIYEHSNLLENGIIPTPKTPGV